MLRMDNSNFNFNGTSVIEDAMIASMNANYNGDGVNVYFNLNINDITAYLANMEAVDADFNAFKTQVFEALDTVM